MSPDGNPTAPTCAHCGLPLPLESRYCIECGAPASRVPGSGSRVQGETLRGETRRCSDAEPGARSGERLTSEPEGLLLAQANLLRMRGRWEAAAGQCAEVLRRHPCSASAHSLLGDIYENQGRLEDAIHWYQAALELNPESVADRAKLARALELQRARAARRPIERPAPPPISWVRVATVAGVAFCCTILALAIVVSASDRGLTRNPQPAVRNGSAAAVERPPAAFSWRRAEPLQTSRERALLLALRGVTEPAPGTTGTAMPLRSIALALDPRGPSASLTLLLEPNRGPWQAGMMAAEGSAARLQREVLRAALRMARLDPSLALLHVRVLVPMTDPADRRAPELVFVATLDARSLPADIAFLSDSEVTLLFRDAWWGPPFAR